MHVTLKNEYRIFSKTRKSFDVRYIRNFPGNRRLIYMNLSSLLWRICARVVFMWTHVQYDVLRPLFLAVCCMWAWTRTPKQRFAFTSNITLRGCWPVLSHQYLTCCGRHYYKADGRFHFCLLLTEFPPKWTLHCHITTALVKCFDSKHISSRCTPSCTMRAVC